MENTKKILTVLGLLVGATYSWMEPALRKVGKLEKPDVRVAVEYDEGVGTPDVRKLTREIHRTMIKGNEQHLRDVLEFAFFLSGQDIKQKVGLTDDQAAFILKIYELNPFVDRLQIQRDGGDGGDSSDEELDFTGQREISVLRELKQNDALNSFAAGVESVLRNLIQKMINQYYHDGSWSTLLEPTELDNPDEHIFSMVTSEEILDKITFTQRLHRLKSFMPYSFVRKHLVDRVEIMIDRLDPVLKDEYDADIEDEDLKREVYEYLDAIVWQLEGKKKEEMRRERKTIDFVIGFLNPDPETQYAKYEPYFTFWSDDE